MIETEYILEATQQHVVVVGTIIAAWLYVTKRSVRLSCRRFRFDRVRSVGTGGFAILPAIAANSNPLP
jgi:hypothetical protein